MRSLHRRARRPRRAGVRRGRPGRRVSRPCRLFPLSGPGGPSRPGSPSSLSDPGDASGFCGPSRTSTRLTSPAGPGRSSGRIRHDPRPRAGRRVGGLLPHRATGRRVGGLVPHSAAGRRVVPGPGLPGGRGHGRLERGRRILQHHGDRVTRGCQGRRDAGTGFPEPAPGPADRAPLAFRGLVVGGRALPYVPLRVAAAQRGPDLVTQLPRHAACSRADQPPLELADRVAAWLPVRHVAPSSLSLSSCVLPATACARRPSTRALSPFSAVSMMTFSAFRFSIPSMGTRRSTLRS
jgi:hypothetical protein